MARSRRAFVAGVATAVAAGLAGCGAPSPDDLPPLVDVEPNYRGWFDGVGTYRGTHDYRDEDEVEVLVGVSGDLGYYKFGPPAVAVSPGTTVEWEWTGRGGAHDVVHEHGAFDSGDPVASSSETFEYTFDEPAVYRYYCAPHRGQGMRGAVFVALDE